ncbi:Spo24p KNAG_0B02080 [Huiozyma naganishii CBS 8797]|uniref:Uncharacterized protein n=1 Tax=Huiozyma naganishii (strain ATCC MYA-139 / BCRC 22969 / CBS 8797 / KCTC 17520 / NBRC 10181 / NCYC 3082 / Yp74L-3) TaxID=1071383 RepID=J7R1G1_HUIN7|nr:hypothetical protein KNAG_0B02080 [Kazachstania naganishii CBS 8797]CCK68650.1 hypothetical protein KNAG_0B02080 [Kazachstania naganishii CBS 8797]
MAFLPLLNAETSEPFVIPHLSPVTPQASRKNSDAYCTQLDALDTALAINAALGKNMELVEANTASAVGDAPARGRKGSLTLL